MTIRCACDHCGTSLKVKDELAGTDGKCPKCKKTFHIPDASSEDDSGAVVLGEDTDKVQTPSRSAEEDEEAAIFGDDFFKMDDVPTRPRHTMPVFDQEDEDEEPPAEKKKSRKRKNAGGDSADDSDGGGGRLPGDNAASIAGSLLSKTGKKNRPSDFKEEEPEEGGYDFSEIKYLLTHRILPGGAAAIIMFTLFYSLFGSMMNMAPDLPELSELTGRITQNGSPVAAKLFFTPIRVGGEGGGSGSAGESDSSGEYEAFYKPDIPGVVPGPLEVTIYADGKKVVRQINVESGSRVVDFELSEEAGADN